MSLLATVLAGGVFGLALAAPPGPMNAIIAAESVVRGWSAGFRAGLGAMAADVLFFLFALAGVVAVVDQYSSVRPALYLVGGLLMLYFAFGSMSEVRDAAAFTDEERRSSSGFRKTFALSVTNPYQIGFWLTVGVGLLESGRLDVFAHVPGASEALRGTLVVQTGSPTLLLGFFGGIALWITLFPAALGSAGRRVDAIAPITAALSALVLAGFGAVFLAMGVVRIL